MIKIEYGHDIKMIDQIQILVLVSDKILDYVLGSWISPSFANQDKCTVKSPELLF